MTLTFEQLQKIAPAAQKENIEKYLPFLVAAMHLFEINTVKRMSAFLGQILVESGCFETIQENLFYTKPERLMAVYGKKCFPTVEIAQQYIKNPQKLANRVYSKSFNKWLGNGDEASGDGWNYAGKGLIQLTGRYNFTQASKAIGVDFIANPELVLQPKYACLTSAWFFKHNGLNELADKNLFDELTERVNNAKLHLEERRAFYKKALQVLGD